MCWGLTSFLSSPLLARSLPVLFFSPASKWITSSMWALLLEIFFQEPIMIIISSLLFSDRVVSRLSDEITAVAGL